MVDHHAWQGGSFTTFSVRATLLCLEHKSRFLQTPFDPGVAARATRAFVPVMEVFDAPAHVSATILVGGEFGRVTVRNLRPSITRTTLLRAAKVYGQFLGRDFNPLDKLLLLRTSGPIYLPFIFLGRRSGHHG